MRRSGFSAYRAARFESVRLEGGQIMPTVMGRRAFMMD